MKNETITIALTDARPIRVTKALWPLVAKASDDRDHNNQEKFRRAYIRVRIHGARSEKAKLEYYGGGKEGSLALRLHPDQRCIVQAWTESSYQTEDGAEAAYVCTLDEAAETIRQAGEEAGVGETLIWEACADLPPIDEVEVEDFSEQELEEMLKAKKAVNQ
jgi:hypothetical protein